MPPAQTCRQCSAPFETDEAFLAHLDKVSPTIGGTKHAIPPPTLCPACRMQRRLAVRNERILHKRKSAKTGKPILAIYAPEEPFPVYTLEEWWSDDWDALDYGREFDFSKQFFPQFRALQEAVPRLQFLQYQNENSEYTNCVSHLKNCYLLFSSDVDQDCQYGAWVQRSKNCTDNLQLDDSQLCYDNVFSRKMYNCVSCVYSSNCTDGAFLFDCKGCATCFLCHGLRQKKHCIMNVQYTPEEYAKKLAEFPMSSRKNYVLARERFREMMRGAIHPRIWSTGRIENCSGDLLTDCANCRDCFEILGSKDCRNIQGGYELKDTVDACYVNGELGYELCESFPSPFQSSFCMNSYTGSTHLYTDQCMSECTNLFGCVGLKKKNWCILNKQYTQAEYEALVPKIIAHMRKTGEWGEFFPIALSPYAYNETMAQDEFTLTEEQAVAKGWRWRELPQEVKGRAKKEPPDRIADVTDATIESPFVCGTCGKKFKVIAQELAFYKTTSLPLPADCFECRHRRRLDIRNPHRVHKRPCAKCAKPMDTTYAPDRPEKVYCDECYLQAVY